MKEMMTPVYQAPGFAVFRERRGFSVYEMSALSGCLVSVEPTLEEAQARLAKQSTVNEAGLRLIRAGKIVLKNAWRRIPGNNKMIGQCMFAPEAIKDAGEETR